MRARMSCETLRPLFLLEIGGALGAGRLAALRLPKGVDEEVMAKVVGASETERPRGGDGQAWSEER